jgi:hypothetical protein
MADQKPIEQLIQEARVLGPTRVIRDPDPAKVTREQAEQVAAAVRAFRARTGVSNSYIGRAVGIYADDVSDVLLGRLRGTWQQTVCDLDRWLEDEHAREQAPKPATFVKTRVAEEIYTVAEAAISLRTIAVVHGPSGIGKTLALRAVAAEKPGTVFVSVETAAATGAGIIAALAKALRANTRPRYLSARHVLDRVKDTLAGAPRLLIIDELHKLCSGNAGSDDKPLHVLRDLFDATGAPQLWSSTTDVVAYLERRQANGGREPLAQIRRRIGVARDLTERTTGDDGGPSGQPLFSIEEIRAVFAKSKMRLSPDAARYLAALANVPDSGALGAAVNLVTMTSKLHERRADTLTADMLRASQRLLVNRRAFKALEAGMELQRLRPGTVAKAG